MTSIIHFFIHLFNDAKIEDEKKFLKLNDVEAYKISFHLSNYVGDIVLKRDYFAKKKIRVQSVDGADSISANIAEGFGRHFKKDKVNFYRYSKGSLKENFDWNKKAKVRKLITDKEYIHIYGELNKLPKLLNYLIKFSNEKLKL